MGAWTVRCLKMDKVCLFVVGIRGAGSHSGRYGDGYGFIYIGWYLVGIFFFGCWFFSIRFRGKLFFVVDVFFFFFGLHCTHSVKERKTKKSSRRKKEEKETHKKIFSLVSFFFFF